MKFGKKTLITLGLLISLNTVARADLITNGSFESGTFIPDVHDTMIVSAGSTAISGWNIIGGNPNAWIGSSNDWGLSASNGSYFLDLTGYVNQAPYGGVSQDIATTVGQTYQLSFDLGSSSTYGMPDSIKATAGSTSSIFTSTFTSGTNNWQNEQLTFTATSASTTISLIGNSGSSYIGLDNVAVISAIPLPGTVWLFGSALVGFIGFNRRKPIQQ